MMKTKIGYDDKVRKLLKEKWYFQGFNATPGLLYGPTWSAVKNMPDLLGYGYSAIVKYFEGDKCYYLYAWDDLHNILKELLKNVRKDDNYLSFLLDTTTEISKRLLKYLHSLDDIDLKSKSDKELGELYNDLNLKYAELLAVSHIIEGFTLTTEDKIRELAGKYTKKQAEVLIAPVCHSFLSIEHNEIYKIAKKARELGLFVIDDGALRKYPAIHEMLKKHQKKYFWKNNGYSSAKVLDVGYFISEINEILEKEVDVDEKIKEFEDMKNNKKRKEKLLDKLKNDELKELLEINDVIFRIHDYRKEMMTIFLHYLDMMLVEASIRYDVDIELVRYVKSDELADVPKLVSELKERKKLCVFVYFSDEGYIFTGKEARVYVDELNEQLGIKESDMIKGNCASKGKVEGIVKICRGEKELEKMEEGDILVACMTQPEFVPAMKKAGAVVTDEGGLTCHAAIVSRELGIPCVIGTKVATKVLKDGDRVLVDADTGIVKRMG